MVRIMRSLAASRPPSELADWFGQVCSFELISVLRNMKQRCAVYLPPAEKRHQDATSGSFANVLLHLLVTHLSILHVFSNLCLHYILTEQLFLCEGLASPRIPVFHQHKLINTQQTLQELNFTRIDLISREHF